MAAARNNKHLDLMQCAGLGIQLALTTGLFTYLGYMLDKWIDTPPIFFILGAFLGLGSGMWSVVRAVDQVTGKRFKDDRSEGVDDDSP
jgi:F0F1-type ATP synthase assembly protein I